MMTKLSVHTVAVLVSALSVLASCAQAQSNSKGRDSSVVVGTLKSVDSSGTKFDVQQSGEHLRKLYVNSESKVNFVGLPANGEQKPRAGLGVKATCEKDGRIRTISFTPPVGEPSTLGENRLKMTERELFKEVDKDASNSISYVEFSKYIYHSPKHGPDSFRKADKDSDGTLDMAEFFEALSRVSWWILSRKTADEWFIQADKNRDGMLDSNEFTSVCTSGNHIENIFKRADQDKSESLTQREMAAYIRSVTHGKKRVKKKQK
jgi:Ca2+-binding EF-hand superfamily protein